MNIKSIHTIESEAIAAAAIYTDINSACPYPFGSDAAHHFERTFSAELAKRQAAKSQPDPLYAQALELVIKHQRPSISMVQCLLYIGYNRAARLIEDMETAGVVSPTNSMGIRTMLKTGIPA